MALLERCLTSEVTVNRGFTNDIKVIQCYIKKILEIVYLKSIVKLIILDLTPSLH